MGITAREFTNIVYGRNNSYGWMMEHANVSNISRNDIVAFYKRYYFPANIILTVQGDFSAAEMKAKIEKLFGTWNYTQPAVPPFPKVDNQAQPGIYLATKTDVTQSSFALATWAVCTATRLCRAPGDGGYSGRRIPQQTLPPGSLQAGLRLRRGSGWSLSYDHPGVFEIEGSTKSPSTVDSLRAIFDEVKKLRTDGVTEEK